MTRTSKTTGQAAYETDVAAKPTYHDGTPRKTWDQLPDYARWSWERPTHSLIPKDIDADLVVEKLK